MERPPEPGCHPEMFGPAGNPFAAPEADPSPRELLDDGAGPDSIRRQYLAHEANVKGEGALFLMTGTPASAFMIAGTMSGFPFRFGAGVQILATCTGVLFFAVGVGLRGLQSWARGIAVSLLAGLMCAILYSIGARLTAGSWAAGRWARWGFVPLAIALSGIGRAWVGHCLDVPHDRLGLGHG